MKTRLLTIFFTLVLFFPLAQAQTLVLKPGQTTINFSSIVIGGDGTIHLKGTPSYLNVYWTANYIVGSGNISVICFFNCITPACDSGPIQNCSYTGAPGDAACAIVNPSYYYDRDNAVVCKFFDPSDPTVPLTPFPNRTFMPVAFNVWLSPVSAVIGTEFSLKISVKNVGLFEDYYNASVSTPSPNILAIDNRTSNTYIGPLKGSSYLSTPETGFNYARLTVFTDEPCICITVNSTARSDVTGSYSIDNTGCQTNCVQIKSKLASLPDFGLLGIIQIILLAALLLYLNLNNLNE